MNYQLSQINTVLLPEFQPYTDQFGLITDNAQGNPSGNGLLYTGHYLVGLVEKGLITQAEKDRLAAVFQSCEKIPGLFIRDPVQTGYEAQDDLIGIMGSEAKLVPNKKDRVLTQNIYNYGHNSNADQIDPTDSTSLSKWALRILNLIPFMKNRWVYNPVSPGKFSTSAWLGYRRDVIATIKMAAGQVINPFDWLYWAISTLFLNENSGNNAYILAFHSCIAVEGYGWLTDLIVKHTQKKIANDCGDFGKLLSTYFKDPNHPLIKLLGGVIE